MASSSDESFAFTNSSSEALETTEVMAKEESDIDKSFKRKLQKELFQNGDLNEPETEEPRVKKKKKIKRELNSPPWDAGESEAARVNGTAEAERCLQLKVKEERASFLAPREPSPAPAAASPERRRKKRRRSPSPPARPPSADRPDAPPKKKKKKRKKETSESEDLLVDKFEAEETVVAARPAASPATPATPATSAAKTYPSKEFVHDDDSSDDDRLAPAADPAPVTPFKIRERITFEEEPEERPESESEAEAAPAPRAGRLARYLRGRPALRPAPAPPAAAAAAAAEPDDDAWLLHCPRGLAAAALAGARLSPGARCKLKAAGGSYEALPEPAAARAALLTALPAGWRLRAAGLRGALRLRERVPRPRAPADAPPSPPRALPLPPTRRRHPLLLGADLERALTAAAVAPASHGDTDDKRRGKKKKRDKARRGSPPPAAAWDSERGIEKSLFDF